MDGIRWRTRTGAPRRDLPECNGPWGRVHELFRHRQRGGTRARIVTRPQAEADAEGLITWDVTIDSTAGRAHRHAAGAAKGGSPKKPPGGITAEPVGHGPGGSRGGLTRRIRLAVEQGRKPLSVVITAGQRGDAPQFESDPEAVRVPRPGVGGPRNRPDRVRSAQAYGSRSNRACPRAGAGRPWARCGRAQGGEPFPVPGCTGNGSDNAASVRAGHHAPGSSPKTGPGHTESPACPSARRRRRTARTVMACAPPRHARRRDTRAVATRQPSHHAHRQGTHVSLAGGRRRHREFRPWWATLLPPHTSDASSNPGSVSGRSADSAWQGLLSCPPGKDRMWRADRPARGADSSQTLLR
ncbi:hypothetical protein ACFVFH_09125 [Streptomyces sp. NPDC057697]|uniref:hypothetical protein n=1 Tax=Streptomyces sp. NPDC057697 TaxID=3346219 RepID=UPI003673C823